MSHPTRRSRRLTKAGVGAVAAVALSALPAFADSAPSGTDVVGVGSDAVQYTTQFASDGDVLGDPGYNTTGNNNRAVSFDAVPDANGRSGYLNGSTLASQKPLNPTIILRRGSNPVQRPNGGTAGINALLADSGHKIDYVRLPAPPTGAQETAAHNASGVGDLRTVQIATDVLTVAVTDGSTSAGATDAPAGLSAAELAKIYLGTYLTWGDIPGYSGTTTQKAATIYPLGLPSSATTYKNFLVDLNVANGGTAGQPLTPANPNIVTVEQNDPTVVNAQPHPADTLLPIYKGRDSLYDSGYFKNPNTVFPGGSSVASGVSFLTGTPPDSGTNYTSTTGFYIVFRASDAASTTPWQPGGVKNWAQELFIYKGTSKPFFDSTNGHADIAAAGATPAYNDLGNGYSLN